MVSATVSTCLLSLSLCCGVLWFLCMSGVTMGNVPGTMLSPSPLGLVLDWSGQSSGALGCQGCFSLLSSMFVFCSLPSCFSQVFWLACTPARPMQHLSHMLPCPPMSRRVCQVIARWGPCHALCALLLSIFRCFVCCWTLNVCLVVSVSLSCLCLLRVWLCGHRNNMGFHKLGLLGSRLEPLAWVSTESYGS